ncbi:MAG: hypothetical protein RID81_31590 [Sandaracinaceae bacterium]
MRRCLASMLALATLAACDGGGHFVSTRLQTTYRHRFQFVSARVELVRVGAAEPERTRDVTFPADAATDVELLTGRTLADFEGVPTGTYDVRVTLLDALGRAVDSGSTRVPIDANRSVLVGVSEACGLLSCPTGSDPPDATACSFGRCVAPSCFEDEDGCVEPECASDAECEGTSACTVGRCVGELCVAVPEDSLCPADAFCAGTEGCVTRPVEPTMDAGPADSDAGPLDSGVDSGTCTPSGCEDGDLCTAHACVDGACVTSPLCGGGDYCVAGACHPEPTFALQTSGAPGCIDLGVPHVSPDFAYRRVITGRAGRTAVQTNQQVSCAGDPPQDDPMVFPLGPSGRWEDTLETGAVTDCDFGLYGRWASYATVSGRRSNTVETVYFNSRCASVDTCTRARTYCPPCRGCTASQYCYASSRCAPSPTIRIDTASGPGCVDLGVPHSSPPAIVVRINGRPNATSTQVNERVSCGEPASDAEVRMLDGSGAVVDPLGPTGALSCDASGIYGRWLIRARVDGQLSAPAEVVYYNSGCTGIATCAAGRTACVP